MPHAFGEGGKIGPDLTGSNRANLDYTPVEASPIRRDRTGLSHVYRHHKDGRVPTASWWSCSPPAHAANGDGRDHRADDVESVAKSPQSMMPEGQLELLSKEQLRDLMAYLATTKQRVAGRGLIAVTDGPQINLLADSRLVGCNDTHGIADDPDGWRLPLFWLALDSLAACSAVGVRVAGAKIRRMRPSQPRCRRIGTATIADRESNCMRAI